METGRLELEETCFYKPQLNVNLWEFVKFLMADIFQKLKRKSRKSSSTSIEEDHRPSEEKRSKFDPSEEDCGIDEVRSVLEMAEGVLPKPDIVLKKLEAMETKLDNLESYVNNVDTKVNALCS